MVSLRVNTGDVDEIRSSNYVYGLTQFYMIALQVLRSATAFGSDLEMLSPWIGSTNQLFLQQQLHPDEHSLVDKMCDSVCMSLYVSVLFPFDGPNCPFRHHPFSSNPLHSRHLKQR